MGTIWEKVDKGIILATEYDQFNELSGVAKWNISPTVNWIIICILQKSKAYKIKIHHRSIRFCNPILGAESGGFILSCHYDGILRSPSGSI